MKRRLWLPWWFLSVLLTIGMAAYAAETGRLFRVHDASEGLADNGAQVIICTKTGRMVISSIGHINFYDGSSFNHIDAHSENIYELPEYEGHYHLYFDKAHHLWVKDKYQVTCVDLMTEQFVSDVQGVLNAMGFQGKAEDLFVDGEGSLLLLSGNRLYNCKTKRSFPVRTGKKLQDVGLSEGLFLLFYDDSSIEAFNSTTGKMEYIKSVLDAEEAVKYMRSSVVMEHEGYFYLIRNGVRDEAVLVRIDAATGEGKVLMAPSFHLNNMEIHDGVLYVASQYGYLTYRLDNGETTHYRTLYMTNGHGLETDINDIAFDLQGGMWAGTESNGLLYSKPYASPFKVYEWGNPKAKLLFEESQKHQETLPRRVNCAYRDSRGWIWHGTYSGLKRYRSENDKDPLVVTNEDGLNNNVIHSVIEDVNHNLWVSTSNGISCLLMRGDSIRRIVSFDQEDNVPATSFDNGRVIRLADGTIVMQSSKYVVEFNPANFHTTQDKQSKLYPKLIRLSVNGRTISPGMELDGNVILDRAVTRAKEINVNYDQNTISLLFTGLNYFRPFQTYYRIRVKGFRNEWEVYSPHDGTRRVDDKGMLHYPIIGIPPGHYEIQVQVSMTPDNWDVEPFVWSLNVDEPWWRMTIVYVTLGLLLLGLLIANFVFYNRNIRLKLNRNNIEGGIIKRIKNFVNMCNNMEGETLIPYNSEQDTGREAAENRFVDAMIKIVPYVRDHQQYVSMNVLASEAEMDISEFYEMMSSNLYVAPRVVVLRLRLQRAAELLRTTGKTVEDIAEELRFVSPNYLIASFYHQYRQTPADYRASNPR